MTRKWNATLRHPKMYPHTKFVIPTLKNKGDMNRTRSRTDGQTDNAITICLPKLLWGHKNYLAEVHRVFEIKDLISGDAFSKSLSIYFIYKLVNGMTHWKQSWEFQRKYFQHSKRFVPCWNTAFGLSGYSLFARKLRFEVSSLQRVNP